MVRRVATGLWLPNGKLNQVISRFFNFLLGLVFRVLWLFAFWSLQVLARVFWALVGAAITAAIRLSPIFFQIAVGATASILAGLDQSLGGLATRNSIVTYLAAGGLWAVPIGALIPLLFSILFNAEPIFFSIPLAIIGTVFGMTCGHQAQRLPGWGIWGSEDGIQIGETTR